MKRLSKEYMSNRLFAICKASMQRRVADSITNDLWWNSRESLGRKVCEMIFVIQAELR